MSINTLGGKHHRGEELFQLKHDVGTGTNGYELAMSKLLLRWRWTKFMNRMLQHGLHDMARYDMLCYAMTWLPMTAGDWTSGSPFQWYIPMFLDSLITRRGVVSSLSTWGRVG